MVEVRGNELTKVFGDGTRALDRVSFVAERGRVLTLLGPSGCGKSTLLRIVAGLERATSGSLEADGRRLDDVPAGERQVGFVFQNYALYPHLTVEGNLGLALEAQRVPRDERRARVRDTAAMLGIGDLLRRRPGQLSGGQQQRVALGRALVRRPRLYLLDEPLSNLDAHLRETMRAELKTLFAEVGATVLHVTHDQTEAMSLADRIAVMRAGRILQAGSPLEIYRRPSDVFVASFVGSPRMTIWEGTTQGRALACRGVEVPLPALGNDDRLHEGRRLRVGIRPEDAELHVTAQPGSWAVERTVVETLGARVLVTVRAGGEEARVLAEPRDWPERAWLRWPPDRLHWFDTDGARLGADGA